MRKALEDLIQQCQQAEEQAGRGAGERLRLLLAIDLLKKARYLLSGIPE